MTGAFSRQQRRKMVEPLRSSGCDSQQLPPSNCFGRRLERSRRYRRFGELVAQRASRQGVFQAAMNDPLPTLRISLQDDADASNGSSDIAASVL